MLNTEQVSQATTDGIKKIISNNIGRCKLAHELLQKGKSKTLWGKREYVSGEDANNVQNLIDSVSNSLSDIKALLDTIYLVNNFNELEKKERSTTSINSFPVKKKNTTGTHPVRHNIGGGYHPKKQVMVINKKTNHKTIYKSIRSATKGLGCYSSKLYSYADSGRLLDGKYQISIIENSEVKDKEIKLP